MKSIFCIVGFCLLGLCRAFGDAVFLTEPYLQNVKPSGMTVMWELSTLRAGAVEYGLDTGYGLSVAAVSASSGFGTYIYRTVLTGLNAGADYHYRVVLDGVDYSADRMFSTAPDAPVDFAFGVWADSQWTNAGYYPADPYEPTKAMMAHLAQSGADFAVGAGDFAEDGDEYTPTHVYYLDRVARYLGPAIPWFAAWGNHDRGQTAVIRKFADMPARTGSPTTPVGPASRSTTPAAISCVSITTRWISTSRCG